MEEEPIRQATECDFCGFKTTDLHHISLARLRPILQPIERGEKAAWLCTVCYSTPAGNALQYPDQFPEARVLKMLAWCTNHLLAEMKGKS